MIKLQTTVLVESAEASGGSFPAKMKIKAPPRSCDRGFTLDAKSLSSYWRISTVANKG